MKKTTKILFLLAISAIIIGGCSSGQKQAAQPQPLAAPQKQNIQTNTAAGNAQNQITEAKISIENFSFNPGTLIIKAGATVTWTNNDSAPHKIKSNDFNSDTLATGASYSFTFEKAGVYDYICGIHPSMQGKIIVE